PLCISSSSPTRRASDLLDMINGEAVNHTPVWFMRQAGRSQPEYRKLKEKYSLFEITHQPELCAYVTHLPVDNYNTDAAVLYKDIDRKSTRLNSSHVSMS